MMIMIMFGVDYDDDFNDDDLLMVMNSNMQRDDDIDGDCIYENVGVYIGDLLYERMHCWVICSFIHKCPDAMFVILFDIQRRYLWYGFVSISDVYDTFVSWGDNLGDDRFHMHIESCIDALHTFGEVVKCAIFDYVLGEPWWFMCIGELGELCTWWNLVKMCTWWCLLFFVILVHLVILVDNIYFGESNEVWIICMWFDDLFGDDDFHAYTFEMMNCIVELIRLNEE